MKSVYSRLVVLSWDDIQQLWLERSGVGSPEQSSGRYYADQPLPLSPQSHGYFRH